MGSPTWFKAFSRSKVDEFALHTQLVRLRTVSGRAAGLDLRKREPQGPSGCRDGLASGGNRRPFCRLWVMEPVFNLRTTTSHNCAAVSRRARIRGAETCVSLNSRRGSNKEEEEEKREPAKRGVRETTGYEPLERD